jgi:small conductance mechanosensitive channel
VPVGFTKVEDATEVLQQAARAFAEDPEWADDLVDPPTVLGVERVSVDGAVLRVTVKTTIEAQPRVGRELRTRLTAALGDAGILDALTSGRVYVRSNNDDDATGGSTTPAPPI